MMRLFQQQQRTNYFNLFTLSTTSMILIILFVIAIIFPSTIAFQSSSLSYERRTSCGFTVPTSMARLNTGPYTNISPLATICYATKKGFGKSSPSTSPSTSKSKSTPSKVTSTTSSIETSTTTPPTTKPVEVSSSTTTTSSVTSKPQQLQLQQQEQEKTKVESMNAGQRALQEMRRQRVEEKDQELRQIREIIEIDQQIQQSTRKKNKKNDNNDNDDTISSPSLTMSIPELVAQRMGLRMISFVGIPFFGGMITFIIFWYYATYENLKFEPTLVAITTIALLLIGLLGITYSVMSASWDPDREGSFFGWDEFQINLQNIRDGLSRSRSNAILRDKMSSLSNDEIQKALQDLDQRERKNKK